MAISTEQLEAPFNMFKAKHRDLDRDVISLDPTLSPEQLRAWTHQNQLICPGCGTNVDYRRQGLRRAHFSHRANMGCHYNAGDPEVVAARAALYSLLVSKVTAKGGRVDLEVHLPGTPENDLVDVWLELPGSQPVAYRICKTGLRPARLEELAASTRKAGAIPRYLLTLSRRIFEEPTPDPAHPRLSIPAPDRHFFFWREWDRYHVRTLAEPQHYDSIAYIDPMAERLYLYRRLIRPGNCNPSIHDYSAAHEAPLGEMLIYKSDLVFPDEKDSKKDWEQWAEAERERQKQEEQARVLREAQLAARLQGKTPPSPALTVLPVSPSSSTAPVRQTPRKRERAEELRCVICGQLTRDWWTRIRPGEGKCRACLYRSKGLEPKFCSRCGSAFPPNYVMINGLCPDCR